jgi:DUF971 family protein
LTDNKFFAKEVAVNTAEQTMMIFWGDGHRSVYTLEGLRMSCPCAVCAGGHEFMGRPVDPAVFKIPPSRTWTVTGLNEMGNYAVQIVWGDGHDSGIYRWESLREMCPCEECFPG